MNDEINPFIEIARLVAAGIIGGLIATIAAHKLAAGREHAAAIMAEKKKFLPVIDGLIEETRKTTNPGFVRNNMFHRLDEPHLTFRLHLKGRRLHAFDEAWKNLQNTTKDEVKSQYIFAENAPELHNIQKLLLNRFEALRKVVMEF